MDVEAAISAIRRAVRIRDAIAAMKLDIENALGALQSLEKHADGPSILSSLESDLRSQREDERLQLRKKQQQAAASAAKLLSNPEATSADCVRIVGMLRLCTSVFGPSQSSNGAGLSLPLFFVEARMRCLSVQADASLGAAAACNASLFAAVAALMAGPVLRLVSDFRLCFLEDTDRHGTKSGTRHVRGFQPSEVLLDAWNQARRHGESVLADFLFGRIEWFLRAIETLAGAAQSTSALAEYWRRLSDMDGAFVRAQASFFCLAQDVILDRARRLVSASGDATLAAVTSRLQSLGQSASMSISRGTTSPQPSGDHEPTVSRGLEVDGGVRSLDVTPALCTTSFEVANAAAHISSSATSGSENSFAVGTVPPAVSDYRMAIGSTAAILPPTTGRDPKDASDTSSSGAVALEIPPSNNSKREIAAPIEIRGMPLLVLVYNGVLAHDYFDQLRGLALPALRPTALECTRALVCGLRNALASHPLTTPDILAAYDAVVAPMYVSVTERYYPVDCVLG